MINTEMSTTATRKWRTSTFAALRLFFLIMASFGCLQLVQAQTTFTYDASGNRLAKVVTGQAAVASLSGSQTVTAGQPASLTVVLTGNAPWSLTLAGGNSPVSFAGITSSPFICSVTPGSSTTYTLGVVRNSCGAGTFGGSAFVTVISGNCTVMFTVKDGLWSDPTVWSCNRVPVSADPVTVNHVVIVPASYVANALRVSFGVGGGVVYGVGSRLRLGP